MLHLPAAVQRVSRTRWPTLQADVRSLYCSSECRLRDKGTPSPAMRPSGPVKLTAPIPDSLSPLARPSPYSRAHGISPLPPRSTSSGSSDSSSPLQSPSTNPSGLDSPYPRKESFNLPPPAYALPQSLGFSGSVPVKIPPLAAQLPPAPSPQPGPTHAGTSIETLRFGRKSGMINSVTSPNALLPRCACGKPFGHPQDHTLEVENGFSKLALGPSLNDHKHLTSRMVSDSALGAPSPPAFRAQSGHATPQHMSGMSGSLLSRSRSDPIPPVLKSGRGQVAPMTAQKDSVIRRASHANPERPAVFDTSATLSPRRGRSRERQHHEADEISSPSLLNHPPEREHPPSRSRPRHTERRRSDEDRERLRQAREREREAERRDRSGLSPLDTSTPQILPSWSRRNVDPSPGEGLVPRRPGSGSPAKVSPGSPLGQGNVSDGERRK